MESGHFHAPRSGSPSISRATGNHNRYTRSPLPARQPSKQCTTLKQKASPQAPTDAFCLLQATIPMILRAASGIEPTFIGTQVPFRGIRYETLHFCYVSRTVWTRLLVCRMAIFVETFRGTLQPIHRFT